MMNIEAPTPAENPNFAPVSVKLLLPEPILNSLVSLYNDIETDVSKAGKTGIALSNKGGK